MNAGAAWRSGAGRRLMLGRVRAAVSGIGGAAKANAGVDVWSLISSTQGA